MRKTQQPSTTSHNAKSHPRCASRSRQRSVDDSPLALSRLRREVQNYLITCEIESHSDATLAGKRCDLGKLLWFLETKKYDVCDHAALQAFFLYLRNGHKEPGGRWDNVRETKPMKPGRTKKYHSQIRAFFNWMVREYELSVSPMAKIPPPIDRPDQVQPFTQDQLARLFSAARRTAHPKRDVAILSLMLETGLRCSEVCALTLADVDITGRSGGSVTVQEGKGGKRRKVHFTSETKKALFEYLREQGAVTGEGADNEPLFLSDRGNGAGGPLTRHGLRFLFSRLGRAASLKGVRCSPHTLRHTFAVEFLRSGGNVFTIKEILGHTTLTMTNRYVAIAQADIETQAQAHSPLRRLKRKVNIR